MEIHVPSELRLLAGHPEVDLVHLTAESRAGEAMAALYPNLRSFTDRVTTSLDVAQVARDSDVVFLALPNGRAMELAPAIVPQARVVDLGADFRFRDAATYEQAKTPSSSSLGCGPRPA